jgi:hypothetical protein
MTSSTEQASVAQMPRTGLPDFFIVGHPKCGTTALYEMLSRHEQIHMPVKEPWYFASDQVVLPVEGVARTLQEYRSLFNGAGPDQRIGEATPSYLRSRNAAARIAELRPDARIVAILREPAAFLRSFHLQSLQAGIETEKHLRKALALEQHRREGRKIPPGCIRPEALLYSEHVRYTEQLRRYHAVFPPEQVLVLIYDDFRADNEATVREVLRFLDVDEMSPVEIVQANPTVRLRSRRGQELLRSFYEDRGTAARAIKAAVKATTPTALRRSALQTAQRRLVYGAPRAPDEALTLQLRHRYKDEVVALSDYLGRDLVTLWGYDGIA